MVYIIKYPDLQYYVRVSSVWNCRGDTKNIEH
jgi:hypothetical protein